MRWQVLKKTRSPNAPRVCVTSMSIIPDLYMVISEGLVHFYPSVWAFCHILMIM
jgi:hypothetical protein